MKLVVLHYHLGLGGVTRVIVNHLRALDVTLEHEQLDVLLVSSSGRDGWPADFDAGVSRLRIRSAVVAEVDYDERVGDVTPSFLSERLLEALRKHGFGPDETVIHVHNHALGKNASLPEALQRLAGHGYRLLLQIHDFCEDYRPHLYAALLRHFEGRRTLAAALYPQSPRIHYAVLTSCDRELLTQAGFDRSRLVCLPNPVEAGPVAAHGAGRDRLRQALGLRQDGRLVVYPVRAILRKNVGEALLWAQLLEHGDVVGVTQPPVSAIDQARYDGWRRLTHELGLSLQFELGSRFAYAELLGAADWLLTTSVAEGFGMVFLESCLAGRPLIGRDLPAVTADFKASGVRLDSVAASLDIPLDWVGESRFRDAFCNAYDTVLAAYDIERPGAVEDAVESLTAAGRVDFGRLTPPLQSRVLDAIAADPARVEAVHECNPWIAEALNRPGDQRRQTVAVNAGVVREHYSREAIGRQLLSLYREILGSPSAEGTAHAADGERLLAAFLDPMRFMPPRTAA